MQNKTKNRMAVIVCAVPGVRNHEQDHECRSRD